LGWVGEDRRGLLTAFPLERGKAPADLAEFARTYKEGEFQAVVAAVNASREVVMRRVIALNEGFSEADMPRVQEVFGKLNTENAQPGDRVQAADGTWGMKK
jgi:uncharacterized protein YdbL (DUF1318 family)